MSKQTEKFVKGALVLSIAGILAKVISVFFRIPLVYLAGYEGSGYYQTVYPMYAILVSIGLVGIPSTVSKLIAEDVALGNYYKAQKTFKDALIFGVGFGAVISLLLGLGANLIIELYGWPIGTRYVIWGLSLSPVFVCISGVLRGYFQGFQIMKPSAISQIIENSSKVIIGMSFVALFMAQNIGVDKAVGGAAIGTSIGSFLAATFMTIRYRIHIKKLKVNETKSIKSKGFFLRDIKSIVILAIPISIATASFSFMNLTDTFTLYHQLAKIGLNDKAANIIIGQMGNASAIITFPLTISLAISVSIVPAVSESKAIKNILELTNKINQAVKLALMLALPAAAGLFVLAKPLMQLFYPTNSEGYDYLKLYSICLIFIIIGQTLTGVLLGASRYYAPLLSIAVAMIVKIILNIILVPTALAAEGAVISSIAFFMVFVVVNYIALKREVKIKLDFLNVFLKPILGTALMFFIIQYAYKIILNTLHKNYLAVFLTVGIGGVVYLSVLLFTKTFTRDELSMLPKHERIIGFLEKRNLIN